MEVKHLDARTRGGKDAVVLKRTRHLALEASRAFVGVDEQGLLHGSLSQVDRLEQEPQQRMQPGT
jgi:hypothetical protein